MKPLNELLEESAAFHGHLCPGQILGVRMAMTGCRLAGIDDPKSSKNLIVYVEIDRCATDAIQSVTGCKLGKRTMKHLDYGKMAATFCNLEKGTAVRIHARDDSRDLATAFATPGGTKKEAQSQAYMVLPDDQLFTITPVNLQPSQEDLPGHPLSRVTCDECGEGVSDRREVHLEGRALCRSCANGAYYLSEGTMARPETPAAPPVVAIVGYSNSGKTRVAASLVKILSRQGYRVAAIKHCPHGHDSGPRDSDSRRLYDEGAIRVIASSPDKVTIQERVSHDASLATLASLVHEDADLVVAEGFKSSGAPKVLVLDDLSEPGPLRNVIATVNGDGGPWGCPRYGFDDLESLAGLISREFLAHLHRERTKIPA
ncbi:MAG: molybdopterin-guanine dinucleotide biosynthesis protein B [Planctomyces sp.]|nr:molybdopterin-guanine dinucleotide biosynthesis protein B [Planctomyces sp.]